MKRHLVCLGICALVFLLAPWFKARPAERSALSLQLHDGILGWVSFSAEPEVDDCRLLRSSEGSQLWTCSEYNVEVSARRVNGENLLTAAVDRKDGTPFFLYRAEFSVSVAHAPGDGLWSYNRIPYPGIVNTSLEEPIETITAPNIGIPLAVLVDGRDYFPDFSALLGQIRTQLGMRVMFWMQQYALGRRSMHYTDLKDALTHIRDPATGELDETVALCPRVFATGQHMVNLFQRIMDDYQPESFWFDWQEQIPVECSAWHHHDYATFGAGYNATQQTILRSLRERDPELFVEMRWPYANLNNKPYAHLWQPIDSPQNFHFMRLQAMNMRAFSSGVVIGTDEMYWKSELSDPEAARYMATVVFTGVPYFGPDLRQETASRRRMLKSWLNFYLRNQSNLINGTFEPYGDVNHPDQKIESPAATYIYYGSPYNGSVPLSTPSPRIVVVNASASPGIDLRLSGLAPGLYRAEISDIYLSPMKPFLIFLRSDFHLQQDVPVGCLLTLIRINPNRPSARVTQFSILPIRIHEENPELDRAAFTDLRPSTSPQKNFPEK